MSAYTFKNSIVLHDNQPLQTLDSTGTSRSNVLLVNNSETFFTGIKNNPIYINQGVTGSSLFINNSIGNNVIVRSKLGVHLENDSNITADITIPKGGYIGNDSIVSINDSFIGLTGGYNLDSTSGSRVILRGNNAEGSAGNLELYCGNNTTGALLVHSGTDSLKLRVLNDGTSIFTPDGTTSAFTVAETIGAFSIPLLLSDTTQSTGVGTGGSMTIKGGASIDKDLYIGGTVTSLSDKRLKENIKPLSGQYLQMIKNIEPMTYNMIGMDRREFGFIAQDFQENFPELLRNPGNGYYTLDYQKITVILMKCIKELEEKYENLK